jgi:DNA-binding transcriptional LysR family regulator
MGTILTDLNELQFFVHVARTHSFTQAARRLGVPKSSVSRAIGRLENRLGVQLLERTTRRVELTELGELYLDRSLRVMEEAEQADLAVGAMQVQPRGRLRIGAPVAFARFILGPVLGQFLAAYPELQLSLQMLDSETVPREGNLDIVIRPGPLEDSGLLRKPIMRIPLGIYASPGYLEASGVLEAPEDLRRHKCITTNCGSRGEPGISAVWRLYRGSELKQVRVEAHVAVPDPTINHQLVAAGAGICLLARSVAEPDVKQGRLARVLPEWEPAPVELHALYSSRLVSSPKVRAFLDFLRDRFGTSLLDDAHPVSHT